MIKRYGIIQPFNLDWRLVAPRDFDTLELFLSPTLSIVFKDIIATRAEGGKAGAQFRIGAYIMQDPNAHTRFLRDVMPQRSNERIESAFKDDTISVFFTLEEGEGLRELFQQQQFICRSLEVHHNGRYCDFARLARTEFEKVVQSFVDLFVVGIVPFDEIDTMIKNMQADIEESAFRRAKEDLEKKQAKNPPTKKRLWTKAGIAAALVAGGVAMAAVGHHLMKGGKWWGYLAGGLCKLVSVGLGLAGKQLGGQVIQHMNVGVVYG